MEVSKQLFEEHIHHLPAVWFEIIPDADHMMVQEDVPEGSWQMSPAYLQRLREWLIT